MEETKGWWRQGTRDQEMMAAIDETDAMAE